MNILEVKFYNEMVHICNGILNMCESSYVSNTI